MNTKFYSDCNSTNIMVLIIYLFIYLIEISSMTTTYVNRFSIDIDLYSFMVSFKLADIIYATI